MQNNIAVYRERIEWAYRYIDSHFYDQVTLNDIAHLVSFAWSNT